MQGKWSAVDVSPSDGAGAASPTGAADDSNPSLDQELLPEKERGHAATVRAAKGRELAARIEFQVFTPVKLGAFPRAVADSRYAPPWKMVGGKREMEARLVAKGYQDSDLKEGLVGTSGCVTLRPSLL